MPAGKQSWLEELCCLDPGTSLAPLSYPKPKLLLSFPSVLITINSLFAPRLAPFAITRLACILMLSMCALAGISQAQTTGRIPAPSSDPGMLIDSGQIVSVRFEGNEHLTDYELRQVVATHVTSGLKKFIYHIIPSLGEPPQYADRVVLEQDVENLEQFYKDNGFMEADVEYQQRFDSVDYKHYIDVLNQNRVTVREARKTLPRVRDTIIFWISEGDEYKIAGLAFIGLESLPEEFQPELTERNTIKLGERWSASVAEAEISRLQHVLEENGYPFFKKDTIIAEVIPKTKTVRVLPYLNPGNRYRFGNVRIEWDTTARSKSRVSDRVILGQLSIDSGQWYKESEVRESETYLNRLGVFESVNLYLDTSVVQNVPQSMRDSMALPMVIRLRMRVPREVTPAVYAGVGGRLGFAAGASASYVDRNVFGGAERFDADIFFQFLPPTQPRRSAGLSLLLPYPFGVRNFPLNISSNYVDTRQYFKELPDSSDYKGDSLEYQDINLRLRLSSTIVLGDPADRTSISPEITAEYVDFYHKYKIDSLFNGKRIEVEDKVYLQKDTTRTNQQVNFIVGTYGIWDQSNDPFNPTTGFILNGGAEVALPILTTFTSDAFSSASYAKWLSQARFYDDLGTIGALIFASRLRFGYTKLFDPDDQHRDPPLERRFFGGGSSSIRGWNSQQLLVSNIPNRRTFEGGFNTLEASIEFRIAPWKYDVSSDDPATFLNPLRLAVFADAGNVWDHTSITKLGINQVAFASGIGLRYNFFLGTFRIDWGLKMYDPNPYWTINGELAAPTDSHGKWIFERNLLNNSDWWALHFGLNQAF